MASYLGERLPAFNIIGGSGLRARVRGQSREGRKGSLTIRAVLRGRRVGRRYSHAHPPEVFSTPLRQSHIMAQVKFGCWQVGEMEFAFYTLDKAHIAEVAQFR
jgi:hypothetical protein